jgi:ParB/RepB/Spo0J family partition protein
MENVTKTNLVELNINNLKKDPNHPRQERGDLEGLTRSIRHDGIMNPIVVQKAEEGRYHILDGDRRAEVAKTLGYETVPCLVYEGLAPNEAAHKSYILNTERNQLNAIECALHIKKMKDEFNYTYDELVILGYGSKSQISKMINLLDLPEKIQKQIVKGKLTQAHGEALRKLKDSAKIERTAKLAIDNDWSAKKTETTVDRVIRKAKKESKKEEPKADVPAQEIPGVYFKDSTNMSEIPDKSVGCIFTSPPYFVGMEFELGYSFDEHQENVKAVMAECARVLVAGGVLALNVADILNFKGKKGTDEIDRVKPMLSFYQSCLSRHGIYLQDQIIWVKDSNPFTQDISVNYTDKTVHAQYRIVNRHEPIYIFRKKGERVLPSEDIILQSRITREEWKVYGPSVWNIDRTRKADGHPAVFPEELARRIIKMYSFVGDTVLDPFLGSGTTIKAARELGRDGVGYERDLRYKATILAKLGIEKPETEGVGEFVQRIIEETEANQPEAPKVEIMASEGMLKYLEEQHSEQEMELETV